MRSIQYVPLHSPLSTRHDTRPMEQIPSYLSASDNVNPIFGINNLFISSQEPDNTHGMTAVFTMQAMFLGASVLLRPE